MSKWGYVPLPAAFCSYTPSGFEQLGETQRDRGILNALHGIHNGQAVVANVTSPSSRESSDEAALI